LFADRIFSGKILPCERLIDDHHMRLRSIVRLAEVASARQSRLHRTEVANAHLAAARFIGDSMLWPPNDLEGRISAGNIGHRNLMRYSDQLHSGQTSSLFHHSPCQRNHLVVLCIAGPRRPQSHHRQMVRLKTDINMQQTVEALTQ
jgi:hypothetical protein